MKKLLFLILIIGIILFGCTWQDARTQNQSNISTQSNLTQQKISTQTSANITDQQDETELKTDLENKTILLLGRSVGNAWMEYLGAEHVCQGQECEESTYEANFDGNTIIYYEMETPPQIINSAINGLGIYEGRADIVFFKLCFDDFESDETGANLKRNEGYVETMYNEVVVKRNKRLIVGNALPKVSEYTDPELVANHRSYNQWLVAFSSSHENVLIFDWYGIVTEPDGSLKSTYSLDKYDSHLNNAAYSKISSEFKELLKNN